MEQATTLEFTMSADYVYLEQLATAIDKALTQVASEADLAVTMYNIKLAVHEICNNIIEHAYAEQGGTIQIKLAFDPANRQFRANLSDTGQPFDASAVTAPTLDVPQEEGYGLFLAQQLMDKVCYSRRGEENHWCLRKVL